MTTIRLVITLLLLSGSFVTQGQETAKIIKDWERAKAYTLEYMEAMPSDQFDFKPTKDVRSFAEQMLHIADANYGLASAGFGIESPVDRGESEKSKDTSRENVIKLVNASYDFVIDHLKTMTQEQLNESIKIFGQFEMDRGTALDK